METVKIKVEPRGETGKSIAKRLRANNMVPAVFYGRGVETVTISVDAKRLKKVVSTEAGTNVIIDLEIKGSKDRQTVIVKELQKNPLTDDFLHVDFLKIAMDEKIEAMVPVVVVGESPGVDQGGVLQHRLWEVEVKALPANLPENIEVEASGLEIGDAVKVAGLPAIEGVEILSDPEETLVSVVPPTELKEEEVIEEELEPELIGEEKEEEEEAAEEEKPEEKPEEESKEESKKESKQETESKEKGK